MCRILCVKSERPFSVVDQLEPFARVSRNSREYQGHGWGCSWLSQNATTDTPDWVHYHNIKPVWEDSLTRFKRDTDNDGEQIQTTLLVAHARSAFRDEGIVVENNMPFTDDHYVFVFNGELRGVRIKEDGRIGAEKIFNYIKRFKNGIASDSDNDAPGMLGMLDKGTRIINKRTRYVRAMNIIMSDGNDVVVSSHFGEDPDYFALRRTRRNDRTIVCSDPWPDGREQEWQRIDNGTVLAI